MKKAIVIGVLAVIFGILTIIDWIVPDPLPLVDEIILSLATVITSGIGVTQLIKKPVEAKSEERE